MKSNISFPQYIFIAAVAPVETAPFLPSNPAEHSQKEECILKINNHRFLASRRVANSIPSSVISKASPPSMSLYPLERFLPSTNVRHFFLSILPVLDSSSGRSALSPSRDERLIDVVESLRSGESGKCVTKSLYSSALGKGRTKEGDGPSIVNGVFLCNCCFSLWKCLCDGRFCVILDGL